MPYQIVEEDKESMGEDSVSSDLQPKVRTHQKPLVMINETDRISSLLLEVEDVKEEG